MPESKKTRTGRYVLPSLHSNHNVWFSTDFSFSSLQLIKPGLDCVLDLGPKDAELVVVCLIAMGAFNNWSLEVEPIDGERFWGRPLLTGGRRVLRMLCVAAQHNSRDGWLGEWAGCHCNGGGRWLAEDREGLQNDVLLWKQAWV
jgi:hypothetical protein